MATHKTCDICGKPGEKNPYQNGPPLRHMPKEEEHGWQPCFEFDLEILIDDKSQHPYEIDLCCECQRIINDKVNEGLKRLEELHRNFYHSI